MPDVANSILFHLLGSLSEEPVRRLAQLSEPKNEVLPTPLVATAFDVEKILEDGELHLRADLHAIIVVPHHQSSIWASRPLVNFVLPGSSANSESCGVPNLGMSERFLDHDLDHKACPTI
jgi:hypothetical protein